MPSSIEIDIRGDKREIAEAFKSISEFDELKGAKLNKNQVQIQINPTVSHATALANVLVTLADHKIEMIDLRITGGASDGAIANLLKEESSRGLTRAYQRSQAASRFLPLWGVILDDLKQGLRHWALVWWVALSLVLAAVWFIETPTTPTREVISSGESSVGVPARTSRTARRSMSEGRRWVGRSPRPWRPKCFGFT